MIAFLSFVGLAAGLSWLTRLPIACSPVAVAAGLVGLLYPAAAIGQVHQAIMLLQAAGLLILAGSLLVYGRRLASPAPMALGTLVRRIGADLRSAPPALILFLIFAGSLWLASRGTRFYLSDEFSHWGSAVKALILTNGLPNAGTELHYWLYPPGAALFDAFFLAGSPFSGGSPPFREDDVLFAQGVFFLSFVSAVMAPLTWRRPLALGLTVGLMTALIATFSPHGAGLLTAYVDHLIGGLAGAAIALQVLLPSRRRFAWVTLLCVFALPLIKDAGLFLALVAATVCGAFELAALMARRPAGTVVLKRLLLVAVLFATPIAAAQSWSLWLAGHQMVPQIAIKGSVAETIGGLIDDRQATPQQKIAAAKFGPALLGILPSGREEPLPMLVYALGALVALIAVVITSRGREQRHAVILTVVSILAFLIFLVGLLRVYSFNLGFDDARLMSSFERYMSIVVLPLWLTPIALLVQPAASPGRMRSRMAVLLVLSGAWLLVLPPWTSTVTHHLQSEAQQSERDRIARRIGFLLERADHTGRIATIWHSRPIGFPYFVPFLEALPHHFDSCVVTRPDASQPTDGLCRLDRAGWAGRLRFFDWLLILRDNAAFRAEMGPMFPAGALDTGLFLYRIDKEPDATVRGLIPMDPDGQRRLVALDDDFFADTLPVLPVDSITADSEDLPAYHKEYLFDGRVDHPIGRAWSSTPTPMPHFVRITLNRPVPLRRMVLFNRAETRLRALDVFTGVQGRETLVARLSGLGDRMTIEVPLTGAPIDSLRIVVRANSVNGADRITGDIGEIVFPGYQVRLPAPR